MIRMVIMEGSEVKAIRHCADEMEGATSVAFFETVDEHSPSERFLGTIKLSMGGKPNG